MAQRIAKNPNLNPQDSAEYLMGKIEAATYGKPSLKAGHSAAEAEAATLRRGLYPHWLEGSDLKSPAHKAAHAAWLQGVRDGIKAQYHKRTLPERSEVSFPANPKADAREARVLDPEEATHSYTVRRELISKLSATK